MRAKDHKFIKQGSAARYLKEARKGPGVPQPAAAITSKNAKNKMKQAHKPA